MKVKILKINENAIIPKYATPGDAGMDLYSMEDYVLKSGERKLFLTGIKMEFSKNYYTRIAPRSGLALKYGIDTLGGVIDSGYRGEYGIILINHGEKDFKVEKGMKIAQVIFEKIGRAKFAIVNELKDTKRKDGGFGHTGNK